MRTISNNDKYNYTPALNDSWIRSITHIMIIRYLIIETMSEGQSRMQNITVMTALMDRTIHNTAHTIYSITITIKAQFNTFVLSSHDLDY